MLHGNPHSWSAGGGRKPHIYSVRCHEPVWRYMPPLCYLVVTSGSARDYRRMISRFTMVTNSCNPANLPSVVEGRASREAALSEIKRPPHPSPHPPPSI